MDAKSPSWAWLNQVISYVRKARTVVAEAWQSVRAGKTRGVFHLGVLLLIGIVLSLRGFKLWRISISMRVASPTPAFEPLAATAGSFVTTGDRPQRYHATAFGRAAVLAPPPVGQTLFQSPVPSRFVPDYPRTGIITYTVRAGDHLASIAAQFGIQRETVIWSNQELESDPGMLYIGQVLNILPIDGVYYTVQQGDTLTEIAERFHAKVELIANCVYNSFGSGERDLTPGQKLVIPDGVKAFQPRVVQLEITPAPADRTRGRGSFVWPVGGYVSQGYWNLHRAIDIAGRHSNVVMAADAGTVVYASWDRSGYGNLVIIDHGNGFTSYYAHLYGFYVDVGDRVKQGQPIGALGNTGHSTGPHLHFEIRENGVQRNPLGLLPGE